MRYDEGRAVSLWHEVEWFADPKSLRVRRRHALSRRTMDAFLQAVEPLARIAAGTGEHADDLANTALAVIARSPRLIGGWRGAGSLSNFLLAVFHSAIGHRRREIARECQIVPGLVQIDRPLSELIAYGRRTNPDIPFRVRDVREAVARMISIRFLPPEQAILRPMIPALLNGYRFARTTPRQERLAGIVLFFVRAFVRRQLQEVA